MQEQSKKLQKPRYFFKNLPILITRALRLMTLPHLNKKITVNFSDNVAQIHGIFQMAHPLKKGRCN